MNKKFKKILPIALVSLCAIGVGVGTMTYSWFVQQGTGSNATFTAGLVNYTLTTSLTNTNKIVPGVNIIGGTDSVKFTNSSTIATDLRVKISYEFTDGSKTVSQGNIPSNTTDTLYKSGTIGDSKAILTLTGINTDSSSGTWEAKTLTVNSTTETWYYTKSTTGIAAGTAVTLFEGTSSSSNVSLILDGTKAGNAYEESTLKLTFIFQAKQHDGVTWETIDGYSSFNWSTGLNSNN